MLQVLRSQTTQELGEELLQSRWKGLQSSNEGSYEGLNQQPVEQYLYHNTCPKKCTSCLLGDNFDDIGSTIGILFAELQIYFVARK